MLSRVIERWLRRIVPMSWRSVAARDYVLIGGVVAFHVTLGMWISLSLR